MALTVQQRRDYRDKRDVFRPAANSADIPLSPEGDPLSVAGAFVSVAGEEGIPCQFVTPGNEFQESVSVAGTAVVASRRTARSIREEVGHDVRSGDVIRLTRRGGAVSWHVVKARPDTHPNDGSRRINWQGYDLSPTIGLPTLSQTGGVWTATWAGTF